MTQNKKIAITGGVGSGKSLVAEILTNMGYRVYSCDGIYGEMLMNGVFTDELVSEFGRGILTDDGLVSRHEISRIVFEDEKKLKNLTKITNPAVMEEAMKRMDVVSEEMIFTEVPVLFENGYEKYFDDVIVVMRDYTSRLKCVEMRYGIGEDEAVKRISCQYDYVENDLSRYEVISNDGTTSDLRKKIEKIIKKIKQKK